MPTIPNNFNLQRELDERNSELDWKFGALSTAALVSIPLAERSHYLPEGETQFDSFTDFNDCASRSPVNHMEAVFSYHYDHAMKPENKKWFEDNNYIQNGKIIFSDRYVAVLSGTTHQGNSLKSPVETIRTQGLIPKKLLPKTDTLTWDQYYAPIPQNLKDLGQEFLKRFTIEYEQVDQVHFAEVLKDDMLGVAGYAWNAPDAQDVYYSDSLTFNHAFLIYSLPQWQIFDNYLDPIDNAFIKNLAPSYKFYTYGYRVYIAQENTPEKKSHLFLKNLAFGTTDTEVSCLQQRLLDLGYQLPHAISNYYGVETKTALALFQAGHGIKDDGSHFGPQTRYAMNALPTMGFWDKLFTLFKSYTGSSFGAAEPECPVPTPPLPTPPKYLWGTREQVIHSIRVLCDEYGLSLTDKNIITACIHQESDFNTKAIGTLNTNGTRDYGLCQYNNGKNAQGQAYWIGAGAAFASIDEVLNNPEKNVRIMLNMQKVGKLNLWASFSTGAYKKWL